MNVGPAIKLENVKAHCPKCGKGPLDGIANVSESEPDARPRPGDLTICSYCVTSLIWTEDMGLRLATAEEEAEYDEFVVKLKKALRQR